jgi:hypothetical protein
MNLITSKKFLFSALPLVMLLGGCLEVVRDLGAPTVISTDPDNAENNVSVNKDITATFSELMDPSTINATTFTLKQGASTINANVTYEGVIATLHPNAELAANTLFTATISIEASDLSGNNLEVDKVWSFTTGNAPDTTAPFVVFTSPVDGDNGVAININLAATFSESMDAATINTTTFTLKQGATTISGVVALAGTVATFIPNIALAPNAVFTATITTGSKDLAGNALVANEVWSFTTGNAPDTTAPFVVFTSPVDGDNGVAININLAATFSESMDAATINTTTFTLKQGATTISGVVTLAGTVATFNPNVDLATNSVFTATITTGAKDPAGNALVANEVWSFTTGNAPDTTAPFVVSTIPDNGDTNVATDVNITAVFSETMDPLTINSTTFTLKQGATTIPGVVSFAGTVATFAPIIDLSTNLVFTATITTGAQDLAGNALVANEVWSFTTGNAPDTTAPFVVSTVPDNGDTNVATDTNLTAVFSESMDPATINTTTFTLKQGATTIAGVVTLAGTVASFNPNIALAPNSIFTATITTGAQDLVGNALLIAETWSFTTGNALDTTAPVVTSTIPDNGDINVATDTNLTAVFSESMDAATINTTTFTLKQGATTISGVVTLAGTVATFNPNVDLATNSVFTATITTGAKDPAGNALVANEVWSFTTGNAPDNTAPIVLSTIPNDGDINAATNTNVSAVFSEAMDPLTINSSSFTLALGLTPVAGVVSFAGTIATFDPIVDLIPNATYTATITTEATDLFGNSLAFDEVWSFTALIAQGPLPVDLGTAGNFVILAKSGIDTIPASAITGDIGVSPIDSTAITGFSLILDATGTFATSTQVTGKVFAADFTSPTSVNLTTAINDLQTAATDAAGRPTPDFTELGSGDISGLALVPGLYKWSTGVLINTDVTLVGGRDDVWIFQIAGGITVASGASVILSGGAEPKNIFWNSFGSVALDTGSHLEGIVLSQTEITLATGASIIGRLLSQTAVTLDNSTVVQPAP